mgnify:CR=1 FL=1
MFDDTIKNNIKYANENATDDEIKEVARLSNSEEFIEKLPKVLFLNKNEIPIFWLVISAGYLIIEAENILPSYIEGLMLELNGEGFK